jgi:hypothetical protein
MLLRHREQLTEQTARHPVQYEARVVDTAEGLRRALNDVAVDTIRAGSGGVCEILLLHK